MEKRNKNNHITYIRLGRVDREMEKKTGDPWLEKASRKRRQNEGKNNLEIRNSSIKN